MVSPESIAAQLKRIGFSQSAWGRAEVAELPNVIIPEEEIFECVNGMYEGGFALLVATDVRVLLIDKKPFNYLTVEDLRFDMINEIDYNHRLFGAYVDISTGNRDLKFRSYNQARLRKLIHHVQNCMAEIKKKQVSHQEGQHQHLEQINGHLKTYLIATHKHQQQLQRRLEEAQRKGVIPEDAVPAPKPSPELSDYLLAQGLLAEYEAKLADSMPDAEKDAAKLIPEGEVVGPDIDDLYAEARREVFGGHVDDRDESDRALKIAYSKLPQALRIRKFGRPSLHVPRVPGVSGRDHGDEAPPLVQPQLS